MSIAGLSGVTDASIDRVQVALGDVASPISLSEQRELRQRAIEAYRDATGTDPKLAARARSTDDTPVVGYAIGFDAGGVPHVLSVETSDPASVPARHKELSNRVSQLQSLIDSGDSVTTQSSSWEIELSILAGGGVNNGAGSIDHDIDFYRLTSDGDSSGELFLAEQIMTTQPESYYNYSGDLFHDWSPAQNSPGVNSETLTDLAPADDYNGSGTKTAEIEARNTPKDITWTHNGDVTSESVTTAEQSDKLHGDFSQSYGNGQDSSEHEAPGATIVETDQPSDGFYDLVEVTAKEKFYLPSPYTAPSFSTVSDVQTVNVSFDNL